MPDEKQTIKFGFSGRAYERLDFLVKKTGADDRAEVIRNALRLYDWAVEEVDAGKRIASVDDQGHAISIVMPELEGKNAD